LRSLCFWQCCSHPPALAEEER
jgi:hypothetical protein